MAGAVAHRALALLLLLLFAVALLLPAASALAGEGPAMARRRKLLQPFRLGVPDSDYRKGIATQIAPINLMNIANVLTLMPNLGVRNTGPAAAAAFNKSGESGDGDGDGSKKEKDMEPPPKEQDKRSNRDRAVTSTALTIRALGTLGRNFATNGLWGGAAKSSADFRAAADTEEGGGSSLVSDARSIGQPGFGRTTSKSSGIAATSAQQVIYNETGSGYQQPHDDAAEKATKGEHEHQQHQEEDAPPSSPKPPPPPSARARRYKVLIGATSDYSAAGDYRTVYSSGLGFGRGDYSNRGQRDYDYGQPRNIPEAARSTTRSATAVFDKMDVACGGGGGSSGGSSESQGKDGGDKGCDGPTPPEAMRGEAKSRTTAVVTAPAASSRAAATHTVALGTTAARPLSPNDTFGGRQVILPITPESLAGSDTSGLAVGRSYKYQGLPGLSASSAGGDARLGPSGGLAGSSAEVFNYATGTRSAKARGEFVAAAPAANVGLGVIGRRKNKMAKKKKA